MKKNFVFISDTHCQHKMLEELPKGDVIIHCGDISSRGSEAEIKAFLNWFSLLPFEYKIFIPGNHDFYFERASKFIIDALMSEYPEVTLLNDSSTNVYGIKIWGSPITPYFHNWAFNRFRGSDIERYWDLIDEDTDILVTHGPPAYLENKLSTVVEGEDVGCEDLYNTIMKRVNPKINAFGHIHEGYGTCEDNGTIFINCSVLNRRYELVNEPIKVQYDGEKFILVERFESEEDQFGEI